MTQLKHPIRLTDFGFDCLRARLSLMETQAEFARRFLTSRRSIINWESGATLEPQAKLHRHILNRLIHNLDAEGKLMPREAVLIMFRESQERRGNAEA